MALRDKKTFLGYPSLVLSKFWEEAFLNDRDTSYLWPFKGKKQLPTTGRVLCLTFFIREQEKMKKVSKSQIADVVVEEVAKCWKLSNIQTKTAWNMKLGL